MNNILEEDNISLASRSTQATQKPKQQQSSQGSSSGQTRQILEFSQETQEAKKRHEEKLKQYELQKQARKISVPTNDQEVKMRLRLCNHPICYFGEAPGDRRLRLKTILAKILMETGQLPSFLTTDYQHSQEQQQFDDENEHFWYEGPTQLEEIRKEIAQLSLANAAIRIENSKLKRTLVDPVDEEDVHLHQLSTFNQFDITMCQYADPSCVVKGQFTPDGKYYATAGASGICRLWSIPECQEEMVLTGHLNRVNNIQFHPQFGQTNFQAATASSDKTIRIWNLNFSEDQKQQKQQSTLLKGHNDRVNDIAYHQCNNYLLSCSYDKTWRFWDLEKQSCIYQQTGHKSQVATLSIHPDGSLLFSGDHSGQGIVWDLRIGKCVLQLQGHIKQVLTSDWNANGYHLATGAADNTIRMWDIRRKNCFYVLAGHENFVTCVKWHNIIDQDICSNLQTSLFLASTSFDGTCKIWSPIDWKLIKIFGKKGQPKLTSVAFTKDWNYLAFTSFNRQFQLWNKNENKILDFEAFEQGLQMNMEVEQTQPSNNIVQEYTSQDQQQTQENKMDVEEEEGV